MNWEETIRYFQSREDCREMMLNTYLDQDLIGNANRFAQSEEFQASLELIKFYQPEGKVIADVGAGTGIASIAFANAGFQVFAIEPDASQITGRGAISILKKHFNLNNLEILDGYGERLPLSDQSVDIVYIRQAVHHARDIDQFAADCSRILKPGGMVIAVREHVIFNERDKSQFLSVHPMHSHYGGENAYTIEQYQSSFNNADLKTEKIMKHFDSPINYFPRTKSELDQLPEITRMSIDQRAVALFGFLGKITLVKLLYRNYIYFRIGGPFDERRIPGRMYSFIFRKD